MTNQIGQTNCYYWNPHGHLIGIRKIVIYHDESLIVYLLTIDNKTVKQSCNGNNAMFAMPKSV